MKVITYAWYVNWEEFVYLNTLILDQSVDTMRLSEEYIFKKVWNANLSNQQDQDEQWVKAWMLAKFSNNTFFLTLAQF